MDGDTEVGYKPPPGGLASNFDGRQVSLRLHHDGQLGSFEGSTGNFNVFGVCENHMKGLVSSPKLQKLTVFLHSTSEFKIVGKISRRISLVHYPEPSELQKNSSLSLKQMAERTATSLTNSGHHFGTPTRGIRPRSSRAVSGYTSSMHSSRNKSPMSGAGEQSKPPKRRHVNEPTRSTDQSVQDSGKGHSGVTSTSSLEDHRQKKSKKKKKTED